MLLPCVRASTPALLPYLLSHASQKGYLAELYMAEPTSPFALLLFSVCTCGHTSAHVQTNRLFKKTVLWER